jgi:hypothetical protein
MGEAVAVGESLVVVLAVVLVVVVEMRVVQ